MKMMNRNIIPRAASSWDSKQGFELFSGTALHLYHPAAGSGRNSAAGIS
jgi:hypothetical protein